MNALTEVSARPVRIGALGMDQRQRNTLLLLFSTRCNNRYQLVEETSAEICLLDMDSFSGKQLLQEFRQRQPTLPLILVSLQKQAVSDAQTLFVRKPIPVQNLIDAIEQHSLQMTAESTTTTVTSEIENLTTAQGEPPPPPPSRIPHATRRAASMMARAVEQAFVGMAPDIDLLDPTQTAKIYYNPAHYLQEHLQQALNLAVRHNRNVAIEGPWPAMELLIDEHKVRVAGEERHLRSRCTLPDAMLEVNLRLFDGSSKLDGGSQTYSLPTLFWKVALWASRGRLPEGTSLSQPIYLRHWPNFTRLDVIPYSLAIAALWAKQPHSLIDTASHLQIPQRYVFAFYSAAKSLQLAGETRRAADTLVAPPEIIASAQRGLFGRQLDRLRGGSPS